MSKLEVKQSEQDSTTVIRIQSGKVHVTSGELPFDIEAYTDSKIMVGQEPIKDNDTPAEEMKDATDGEIANTLIGVLRSKGYGVRLVN